MSFSRTPVLIGALLGALLLSAFGAVASPGRADAAGKPLIPVMAFTFHRGVGGGDALSVGVHTIAMASLHLKADYTNGQEINLYGASDDSGYHVFKWTVSYTGSVVTLARFWVYVDRGALHGSTRGSFVVFPARPPVLQVSVLTPQVTVGGTLRVGVHSDRPGIALRLHVRSHVDPSAAAARPAPADLVTRDATTDAMGDWTFSVPLSTTTPISLAQHLDILVTGEFLTRRSVVVSPLLLQPLPGIALPQHANLSYVAARQRAQDAAGGSLSLAQSNARLAVQRLTVDLQVLAQWTASGQPHGTDYYQALVSNAGGYDAYIDATAQALSDDSLVEARMRAVMPHKAVMVSLGEQYLREYEDGVLVHSNDITTGRPELPTVTGHFAIYEKITPYQFISPWPQGSPYYYAPTWIKYWMPFTGGYGLHDAWWRYHYGPGTNIGGDGPGSGEPMGTHGCVNLPFADTVWLWNWAPVGTPVVVYGGPHVAPGGAAGI